MKNQDSANIYLKILQIILLLRDWEVTPMGNLFKNKQTYQQTEMLPAPWEGMLYFRLFFALYLS